MQMTALISVITNAGILCFTMQLIQFSPWGEVWLFIGFQYTIFIAMAIFSYVVEDVPEDVSIQLQRQTYLRERAQMSDEERAKETGKTAHRPSLTTLDQRLMKVRELIFFLFFQ